MQHEKVQISEVETSDSQIKVLEIKGRVDSTVSNIFGDYLREVFENGFNQFVLLLHVEYMSSAAIREMIAFLKDVRRAQGDVKVAELSERMQNIMLISGLDTTFKIFSSLAEAQHAFDAK
jgi:anti-sigma B factor antagonist